jgi:branched-chain amino acid transport system permease protein
MLESQFFTSGVMDTSVYVLLASSFMVIYSVARLLHFAHGTTFVIGAYAGVAVYGATGLAGALIVALLVGALFGLGCDRLIYLPLIGRGATGWVLVIASLGIFSLGENLIGMAFGGDAKSVSDPWLQGTPIHVGLLSWMHWTQAIVLVAAIAWVCGLHWMLAHTRIGIFMRAVATNARLAVWTGVPTGRVRTFAFLLGSAGAAFAGLITYLDLSAEPTMDLTGGLHAVVPFIIGGMGSLAGIVGASVVLGFGGVLVSRYAGSEWSDVVLFAALAVVLFARPQGLQLRHD